MNKWKNRCLSAAWQQEHRSARALQVLWDFMQNISSTLCHSSMNCKNLKVRTKEFILSSILHGPVMRSWHLPCKIQESYAVPNSTATEVSKKNNLSLKYGTVQGSNCICLSMPFHVYNGKNTQLHAVSSLCLFQIWKHMLIILSTWC